MSKVTQYLIHTKLTATDSASKVIQKLSQSTRTSMDESAKSVERLSKELKKLERQVEKYQNRVDAAKGRVLGKIASGFNTIGNVSTMAAMGIGGKIAYDTFGAGMDHERAMSNLVKRFGDPDLKRGTDQFKQLDLTVRGMAKTFGMAHTEVAGMYESLAAAGYTAQAGGKVMPLFLKYSKLADVGPEEATSGLMRSFNVFATARKIRRATPEEWKNTPALAEMMDTNFEKEMSTFADQMSYGADTFATSLGEIHRAMAVAAPVFAQAGVSQEDTIALIGSLSEQGIIGAKGGTGMASLMMRLRSRRGESFDIIKSLGMNFEKFDNGETYDVMGMIAEMGTKLQESNMSAKAQKQILGDVISGAFGDDVNARAAANTAAYLLAGKHHAKTAMALTGVGAEKLRQYSENVRTKSRGRVDQAYATMAGPDREWDVMQAEIQDYKIDMFRDLLPLLREVMPLAKDFFKSLTEFVKNNKDGIRSIGGTLAKWGPSLIAVGVAFKGIGIAMNVAKFVSDIGRMRTAVDMLKKSQDALNTFKGLHAPELAAAGAGTAMDMAPAPKKGGWLAKSARFLGKGAKYVGGGVIGMLAKGATYARLPAIFSSIASAAGTAASAVGTTLTGALASIGVVGAGSVGAFLGALAGIVGSAIYIGGVMWDYLTNPQFARDFDDAWDLAFSSFDTWISALKVTGASLSNIVLGWVESASKFIGLEPPAWLRDARAGLDETLLREGQKGAETYQERRDAAAEKAASDIKLSGSVQGSVQLLTGRKPAGTAPVTGSVQGSYPKSI